MEFDHFKAELDKSYFLNKELAEMVIDKSLPEIQQLINDGVFAKPDMYFAIAIPIIDKRGDKVFAVLSDKQLGVWEEWEDEYDKYAANKIAICVRTGLSVGEVLKSYQHLLQEGDVLCAGAIIEAGIITACSSVEEGETDEKVCRILMDNCLKTLNEVSGSTITNLTERGIYFLGQTATEK